MAKEQKLQETWNVLIDKLSKIALKMEVANIPDKTISWIELSCVNIKAEYYHGIGIDILFFEEGCIVNDIDSQYYGALADNLFTASIGEYGIASQANNFIDNIFWWVEKFKKEQNV